MFDLDGTLSNPLEGIHRCLNYALEHFGYPPISAGRAADCIGPPLDQAFRSLEPSILEMFEIRESPGGTS